jgi:periplasmic glucans biosynthesis protein
MSATMHRLSKRRFGMALFATMATSLIGVAATRQEPAAKPVDRYEFEAGTVREFARRIAAQPRALRQLDRDSPLRGISYDQFRDIRVNPEAAIWRTEQVPFRLEPLPGGFLFTTPVAISIVDHGVARDLSILPETFLLGPSVLKLAGQAIPISGFRLRAHINSRSVWDEFLVFQGASYFRAVGRGGQYGLSARGLALRTAHPTGEEFPTFTHFWIERPAPNATSIVVHALLESDSATGAYRFAVTPGNETVMDVAVTLYPRVPLEGVGIAPLTSMFLFDESNRARIDDFRDEVHDSDGLQVLTESGEQIWRPLANPTRLEVSSFTDRAPRAFGLVQRSRRASDYQDLEARYELRPSAWIEPTSDWGQGSVELVEIPSDRETNDNIVTFWRPKEPLAAGQPWQASYRVRWTSYPRLSPNLGRAVMTRSGPSLDGKRRLFVIDFESNELAAADLRVDAGSSSGRLINVVLQPNPLTKGLRASFELDPSEASVAELRLRILKEDRPVTETWLYRWTAS